VGEGAQDGRPSAADAIIYRLVPTRSVSFLAAFSRSKVVYLGPCMAPEGASPKGIGPIGLAGSENTHLVLAADAVGL
jgi:hypothetical protein